MSKLKCLSYLLHRIVPKVVPFLDRTRNNGYRHKTLQTDLGKAKDSIKEEVMRKKTYERRFKEDL